MSFKLYFKPWTVTWIETEDFGLPALSLENTPGQVSGMELNLWVFSGSWWSTEQSTNVSSALRSELSRRRAVSTPQYFCKHPHSIPVCVQCHPHAQKFRSSPPLPSPVWRALISCSRTTERSFRSETKSTLELQATEVFLQKLIVAQLVKESIIYTPMLSQEPLHSIFSKARWIQSTICSGPLQCCWIFLVVIIILLTWIKIRVWFFW